MPSGTNLGFTKFFGAIIPRQALDFELCYYLANQRLSNRQANYCYGWIFHVATVMASHDQQSITRLDGSCRNEGRDRIGIFHTFSFSFAFF